MNPNEMETKLPQQVIGFFGPIAFSAIKTALSTAIPAALALACQFKGANAEKTETKKIKNNESLTNKQINAIYQILRRAYQKKSKRLEYNDFKIHESISIEPKELLDFVGSNLSDHEHNNTPLTRLVANQKFGLIKSIMNVVGNQELLKANPDLTKRFLNSCDNKGINFLEISSRFYGIMPKELLEKIVSLYAENAEPESIKLTPAVLSLPEDMFRSLSPKIDKTNIEQFTKEIYKQIVASRKEVGLSPLAIYVEKGLENSVSANYYAESDGLPDQGQIRFTDDKTFLYPYLTEGTIASKKLAQKGEEVIRQKVYRPDLTKEDQEAIITALINENPTAARMAEKNAKSNILSLLEKKPDVFSTGVYNPNAQGILSSDKRSGYYI